MRKNELDLVAIAFSLTLSELVPIAAAALFPGIAFGLQPPLTRINASAIEGVVPRGIVPDPVLNFVCPAIRRAWTNGAAAIRKCRRPARRLSSVIR